MHSNILHNSNHFKVFDYIILFVFILLNGSASVGGFKFRFIVFTFFLLLYFTLTKKK